MFKLIHTLYSFLNQMKSFEAGYSTASKDSMIVKYEGRNYRVTLEDLGEGDMGEHVNKLK